MEMHKGHTFERAVEKTVLHSKSFLLKQIQQPPTCLVQRCVYPHNLYRRRIFSDVQSGDTHEVFSGGLSGGSTVTRAC